MARRKAGGNLSEWRAQVLRWFDRKRELLEAKEEKRRKKLDAEQRARGAPEGPTPSECLELSRRFERNLDLFLSLDDDFADSFPNNEREGLRIRRASGIVAHYCWTRGGDGTDPRALAFIDRAAARYVDSGRPDIDIKRALGLTRANRGNPGRVSSGKRSLTPDAYWALGEQLLSNPRRRNAARSDPEHSLTAMTAAEYRASVPTAKRAAAEVRAMLNAHSKGERLTEGEAKKWFAPPRGKRPRRKKSAE